MWLVPVTRQYFPRFAKETRTYLKKLTKASNFVANLQFREVTLNSAVVHDSFLLRCQVTVTH